MGLLAQVADRLGHFTSNASLPILLAAGFTSFILLAVVLNVLKQLLFKNPNEPPLVFHWFPVIGNTVTYGMDPYKFFFQNKQKVSPPPIYPARCRQTTRRGLTCALSSMAMSSPLFFWERK